MAAAARPASTCGTARKWVPQTDWIAAYTDVVDKVVKEQSAEFARTNK